MIKKRMVFDGRCHCGNLSVTFETLKQARDFQVNACQCSFCRRHGARTVTDPEGSARFDAEDPDKLTLYRFGFKTADYLVCGNCGGYLGAVMTEDGKSWATVNVNNLEDREAFGETAQPVSYDIETESGRRARRRARWTPVEGWAKFTR